MAVPVLAIPHHLPGHTNCTSLNRNYSSLHNMHIIIMHISKYVIFIRLVIIFIRSSHNQYSVWTLTFQICTMYTAFLDKEISHQSPGRHLRWYWMHPLKCLCCSRCCAADFVLFCTVLCSCRNRQHSHTTDKYADQSRTFT